MTERPEEPRPRLDVFLRPLSPPTLLGVLLCVNSGILFGAAEVWSGMACLGVGLLLISCAVERHRR